MMSLRNKNSLAFHMGSDTSRALVLGALPMRGKITR